MSFLALGGVGGVVGIELLPLAINLPICYRHFCASRQGVRNVDNYRDPQSLNMLFLPLKEQGHQSTALPISSPPENTSEQAYFGSCQLLN